MVCVLPETGINGKCFSPWQNQTSSRSHFFKTTFAESHPLLTFGNSPVIKASHQKHFGEILDEKLRLRPLEIKNAKIPKKRCCFENAAKYYPRKITLNNLYTAIEIMGMSFTTNLTMEASVRSPIEIMGMSFTTNLTMEASVRLSYLLDTKRL